MGGWKTSLVDPRADFRSVLQLASECGHADIDPVRACALVHQGPSGVAVRSSSSSWEPPTFDDAWYAQVSADSRSFIDS